MVLFRLREGNVAFWLYEMKLWWHNFIIKCNYYRWQVALLVSLNWLTAWRGLRRWACMSRAEQSRLTEVKQLHEVRNIFLFCLNTTKRYIEQFMDLYRGWYWAHKHSLHQTVTSAIEQIRPCSREQALGMSVCVLRACLPAHAWRTPLLALQFSCTPALKSVHFPLYSCQCK